MKVKIDISQRIAIIDGFNFTIDNGVCAIDGYAYEYLSTNDFSNWVAEKHIGQIRFTHRYNEITFQFDVKCSFM